MKRFGLLLALAVLLAGTALSQKSPKRGAAKQPEEARIRQMLAEWKQAFEARDVAGVMKMYAPGAELVAFDVAPPLQHTGYDDYKKDYTEFFAMYEGPLKVEIGETHIAISGDVAYGFGSERVSGTLRGGERSELTLRWTEVWRKRGDRWYVVHEHISVPVDFATGKGVFDAK
jgi:ketosteroid isomerase-like protein